MHFGGSWIPLGWCGNLLRSYFHDPCIWQFVQFAVSTFVTVFGCIFWLVLVNLEYCSLLGDKCAGSSFRSGSTCFVIGRAVWGWALTCSQSSPRL